MILTEFRELQDQEGARIVIKYSNGYNFAISDHIRESEEGLEEHNRLLDIVRSMEVEGTRPRIVMFTGHGDSVAHCVCVTELTDFDFVPGLESFVRKWVGDNEYVHHAW